MDDRARVARAAHAAARAAYAAEDAAYAAERALAPYRIEAADCGWAVYSPTGRLVAVVSDVDFAAALGRVLG